MAIWFLIQEAIILTIFCGVSAIQEDLLEHIQISGNNSPELNDFLKSVLDNKHVFETIRDVAKQFNNKNSKITDPNLVKGLPFIFSSTYFGKANNANVYNEIAFDSPNNGIYPPKRERSHLSNSVDQELFDDIDETAFVNSESQDNYGTRYRRGLDLTNYNKDYDFGSSDIKVFPRSESGIRRVPGKKYARPKTIPLEAQNAPKSDLNNNNDNTNIIKRKSMEENNKDNQDKTVNDRPTNEKSKNLVDVDVDVKKTLHKNDILDITTETTPSSKLLDKRYLDDKEPENWATVTIVFLENHSDDNEVKKNTLQDVDQPTSAIEQKELSTESYRDLSLVPPTRNNFQKLFEGAATNLARDLNNESGTKLAGKIMQDSSISSDEQHNSELNLPGYHEEKNLIKNLNSLRTNYFQSRRIQSISNEEYPYYDSLVYKNERRQVKENNNASLQINKVRDKRSYPDFALTDNRYSFEDDYNQQLNPAWQDEYGDEADIIVPKRIIYDSKKKNTKLTLNGIVKDLNDDDNALYKLHSTSYNNFKDAEGFDTSDSRYGHTTTVYGQIADKPVTQMNIINGQENTCDCKKHKGQHAYCDCNKGCNCIGCNCKNNNDRNARAMINKNKLQEQKDDSNRNIIKHSLISNLPKVRNEFKDSSIETSFNTGNTIESFHYPKFLIARNDLSQLKSKHKMDDMSNYNNIDYDRELFESDNNNNAIIDTPIASTAKTQTNAKNLENEPDLGQIGGITVSSLKPNPDFKRRRDSNNFYHFPITETTHNKISKKELTTFGPENENLDDKYNFDIDNEEESIQEREETKEACNHNNNDAKVLKKHAKEQISQDTEKNIDYEINDSEREDNTINKKYLNNKKHLNNKKQDNVNEDNRQQIKTMSFNTVESFVDIVENDASDDKTMEKRQVVKDSLNYNRENHSNRWNKYSQDKELNGIPYYSHKMLPPKEFQRKHNSHNKRSRLNRAENVNRPSEGLLSNSEDGKQLNIPSKDFKRTQSNSKLHHRLSTEKPHTHKNEFKQWNNAKNDLTSNIGFNAHETCGKDPKKIHNLNEHISEALNGRMAAVLVQKILQEARLNSKLNSRFSGSLSSKHNYKTEIDNLEAFKSNETEKDIKQTEAMLREIMATLNKIVLDQIKIRTCKRLPLDLFKYLKTITSVSNKKEIEDTEVNGEEIPFSIIKNSKTRDAPIESRDAFLFEDKESNKNNYDRDKLEQKVLTIRKLLNKYNDMSPFSKNKVRDVEAYLKEHMKMLEDILSRTQAKKVLETNKVKKDNYLTDRASSDADIYSSKNRNSLSYPSGNMDYPRIRAKGESLVDLRRIRKGTKNELKVPQSDFSVSEQYKKLKHAANSLRQKREQENKLGELFGDPNKHSSSKHHSADNKGNVNLEKGFEEINPIRIGS